MQHRLRILITGCSGFVGGYLIHACQTTYPDAILFGTGRESAGSAQGNVTYLTADMRDAEQVQAVVAHAQPDIIFHLAGQASVAASWRDPATTLAVNGIGAIHLFEAIRQLPQPPRVVVVGSGEEYGPVPVTANPIAETQPLAPTNPYAISKATQDFYALQYATAYQLPIMRVRSFNHFGPGQHDSFVIASFAKQIALIEAGQSDPIIQVGNVHVQRDFLPVQDVVLAYIAVAEHGIPGAVYNVGSGRGYLISDILHRLLAFARQPITVAVDPTRIRPTDLPMIVADITQLHAVTAWQPQHDFDAALLATLQYWREITAP